MFNSQAALSGEYPEKPIQIICWSSPGAPNDLLARELAKVGQKYFKQNMTVLTKKGGSGAVAMGYLLKQKADGYTLSTTTVSQVIAMAAGQIPFKPEQFTFLMRLQMDPFVIAVRKESPFNNLNEFFEYGKNNPGKLSVGGFGTASAHYLAYKRLNIKAGDPDIRWISYNGGADAVVATLGGHTDAVHTNPITVMEHVEASKMKILGISSEKRSPAFPDWKTYTEQGYNLAPVQWRGVMAPAGLSAEVIQKIRSALEETVMDAKFKEFMKNAGVDYA